MGGTTSKYNQATTKESDFTKNHTNIKLMDPVKKFEGPIIIPEGTVGNNDLRLIVQRERQYHLEQGSQIRELLNKMLHFIQIDILANNYNQKNGVLLKKLKNNIKEKEGELKDSKEANFADFRRMNLIESEIREKNRTILLVSIASCVLFILLGVSYFILTRK